MKKVAVVIPCYNEEKYIEKCVMSCLAQEGNDFEVEVLVCDGKSTDATQEVVKRIGEAHRNVKLLINEKKITPVALNLGIKNTDAEVIIILGAHAEAYPDFIKNNLRALEQHPDAGCVGGVIESVYLDKTSAVIGKAMSSAFGVGNAHFRTGNASGYVDTVAFGAYRREVFEKAGYFDEELIRNQDDEFNFRIIRHGFKIFLDPSIRSKYYVRASFSKLYRQYYQYGFWKICANKKNSAVTTVRQLIPFLFVLFLFGFPLLCFFSLYFAWAYAGILLLYFLLSLAAAKGNPGVMGAFFILHFSYGSGYLYGIVYFLLFNRRPPAQQNVTR